MLGSAGPAALPETLRSGLVAVKGCDGHRGDERSAGHDLRPGNRQPAASLRRAADRGELPPNLDIGLLLDVYAGAVFYRVLVSGEPVTDLLAEQLVSLLLDGKAPVKPRAAVSEA